MKTGIIGTVNWELENDVLTFSGGRFGDLFFLKYIIGEEIRCIKKVIFTDKIICGKSLHGSFAECIRLKEIIGLENLDTSNVKFMSHMFSECNSLESLDLTGFDTSNVEHMDWMFYGCPRLKSVGLNNFDTSKVLFMNHMFYGCRSLTSLDVSSFDTSKLFNMGRMFYLCDNLKNKKEIIEFLERGGNNENGENRNSQLGI